MMTLVQDVRTLGQNVRVVGATVRALEACELVPVGTAVARIPAIIPNLPANADTRVRQASAHLGLGLAQVSIGLFQETSVAVGQLLQRVNSGRTLDADDAQALTALAAVERPEHLFLNPHAYPSIWDRRAGRMSAEGLVLLLSAATDPFSPLPKDTWRAMADVTETFLKCCGSTVASLDARLWTWPRLTWAFCCARISPPTTQRLRGRAAQIYIEQALADWDNAIDRYSRAAHNFQRAGAEAWYRLMQSFLGTLYLRRAGSTNGRLEDATTAIEAFEQGRYVAGRDKARAQHAALLITLPIRPQDLLTATDARFGLAVERYQRLGRFRDEATTRRAWLHKKPTLVSPRDATNTLVALDRISTMLGDPTIVADYHTECGDWESAEVYLTGRPEALAHHHALRAQNDTALTPDGRVAHWRKAVAGIATTDVKQARAWQENVVRLLFIYAPERATELLTELETLAAMDERLREMTDAESRFWRWLAVEGRIYRTVEVLLTNDTDDAVLDLLDALQTIQFGQSTPALHTAATTALEKALASLDTALIEATKYENLLHRELAALHLHIASECTLPGDVLHSIPEATAIDPEDPLTRWQMEGIFAAIAVGDYKGAVTLITDWDDIDSLFDVADQFFNAAQYALAANALRAYIASQPQASREPGDDARTRID